MLSGGHTAASTGCAARNSTWCCPLAKVDPGAERPQPGFLSVSEVNSLDRRFWISKPTSAIGLNNFGALGSHFRSARCFIGV